MVRERAKPYTFKVHTGAWSGGEKNLSDIGAPDNLDLSRLDPRVRSPRQPWFAGAGVPAHSFSSQ